MLSVCEPDKPMRPGTQKSRKFAKKLRRQMTSAETILWSRLRRSQLMSLKFRRQHPVGPYIADFACMALKLIVEVDGDTHGTTAELQHDARRSRYLESQGWTIVRAFNVDVYKNMNGVLEQIAEMARNLERAAAFPPPFAGEGDLGVVEGEMPETSASLCPQFWPTPSDPAEAGPPPPQAGEERPHNNNKNSLPPCRKDGQ